MLKITIFGAMKQGLASIGLAIPGQYLDVRDLAALRNVDPDKYTKGLGCHEIALCGLDEDVVTLAVKAAKRALSRWTGDKNDIGLLVTGTETAKDMSRPLSAFVADELGLSGAIRSYEVKHACYGGTLALRQALEWRASGAAKGKVALVIATDVALYAPNDPGEPTQGAGAVAMIVGDPDIAEVDLETHAFSTPVFDFWRPVGESFPRVDGPLSLDCYNRSVVETFSSFAADKSVDDAFADVGKVCFHVPFPKMVKKGVIALGEKNGWSKEKTTEFYDTRVEPTMRWNKKIGNAYTAALWVAVAAALEGMNEGERLTAFSYGSGCGAELLSLRAGKAAANALWSADLEEDFASRTKLSADAYQDYRGEKRNQDGGQLHA